LADRGQLRLATAFLLVVLKDDNFFHAFPAHTRTGHGGLLLVVHGQGLAPPPRPPECVRGTATHLPGRPQRRVSWHQAMRTSSPLRWQVCYLLFLFPPHQGVQGTAVKFIDHPWSLGLSLWSATHLAPSAPRGVGHC
jgi:hypothetical protein